MRQSELASSFFAKFAGLMLRKDLPEGGGMAIVSGEPIHMFFMRFALDVDPWRMTQSVAL